MTSNFGVIPKGNTEKWRVIVNLSAPHSIYKKIYSIIYLLYIYIYIYLFQARYLDKDIVRYMTLHDRYHIVLSHGCIVQAHYQSCYSNLVQVFWVFTATFTLVEPTQPG